MQKLNKDGKYTTLLFSCETAVSGGTSKEEDELAIVEAMIKQSFYILPDSEKSPSRDDFKDIILILFSNS
jgi:hypothetical protein